jgi:hypothetical protein
MENLNENLNENIHDNLDDMPEARIEPKYEMVNSKKGWVAFGITLLCILFFMLLGILKAGQYGYALLWLFHLLSLLLLVS